MSEANDKEDEAKRLKRMTRASLQVMSLSGRIKRTSIMTSNKRLSVISGMGSTSSLLSGSHRSLLAGSHRSLLGAGATESEKHKPTLEPIASSDKVEATDISDCGAPDGDDMSDDEVLQMLADSYREVTGRVMPATMTAEEAYAELRLRTMAAWQGDDESDATDSERASVNDDAPSPQGGTVLDRMRKGVRKSRISLTIAKGKLASAAAPALKEEDWEDELVQMLKASYREFTGRCIPPGMPMQAAEQELRELTMAAWQEERKQATDGVWAEMIEEEVEWEDDDNDDDDGGGSETAASSQKVAELSVAEPEAEAAAGSARAHFASAEGAERGAAPSAAPLTKKSELFRAVTTELQVGSATVFEGWLLKHKQGSFKSDRKRWFVLHENGEVHYFTHPDLLCHKGKFSVRGLGAQDVVYQGFLEVGKWGIEVRTLERTWQLSADVDSQCKAWKRNLESVATKLA